MEFSIKFWHSKVRMVNCIWISLKTIVCLSLKNDFVLANSAGPDEMPH